MYPIRLNLMPADKKNKIENLMRYLFLKHITQIMIIVLCVASIVILVGRYVLEKNLIYLAASFVSISKDAKELNREIKAINDRLVLINATQAFFVPWSRAAEDISNLTPGGIKWNLWDFSVKPGENKIKLTGTAQTRDDIIELAKNLRAVPWVKAVNLPVDELVKIVTEPFKVELDFENARIY